VDRTRWKGPALAGALALGLLGCGGRERLFDGDRAFDHLQAQVAFGPRVPGSEAHRRALEYFRAHLSEHADRVTEHAFEGTSPLDSSRATFTNVVAVFRPESPRRILVGAHWDSRPRADRDPDPAKRSTPVPGANDGASGAAVVLELAHVLAARPPEIGVDLVLFDAEDLGREDEPHTFSLGSQRFVADHPDYRPGYVVILDMVGRRGSRIPREGNSVAGAPKLVEGVWGVAKEIGTTVLVDSTGPPVMDDHIPFLSRGIPAVDLIDLADPAWHTTSDLPENCAPETLEEVGRLVLALLGKAEKAFRP
jgi:hypothetical protein